MRYFFSWTAKDPSLLTEEVVAEIRKLLDVLAKRHGLEVLDFSVREGTVELLLSAPPRYSPADLVNLIKSYTAKSLAVRFPSVKQVKSLWNREYSVWSVGERRDNREDQEGRVDI